jgi:uncharacterized membrane protein YczE
MKNLGEVRLDRARLASMRYSATCLALVRSGKLRQGTLLIVTAVGSILGKARLNLAMSGLVRFGTVLRG